MPTINVTVLGFNSGIGEANSAENVGNQAGVYKQKIGTVLQFKTLKPGTNVTLTENASDIEINSTTGTEVDPVYEADKPTLALKSDLHNPVTVTDTNSINLTLATQALSADVITQNSTSVSLSIDASGLKAVALPAGIDHNSLANYSVNRHFLQTDITNISTALATGLVKVTTPTGALSVITDDSANWNTAYGWGNHASAGYLVAANNLSDLTVAATARTNIGLVAGGAGDIWLQKAGGTMAGNIAMGGNAISNASTINGGTLSGNNSGDVTITDSNSINLSLTGQALSADLVIQDTTSVDLAIDASGLKATVLPAGVSHNSLANLTVGDAHTQYISIAPSAIARNTITIPNATYNGLAIKAFTSQSANTVSINSVGDVLMGGFDSEGRIFGYGGSGITTNLLIGSSGNSTMSGASNIYAGTSSGLASTTANNNIGIGVESLRFIADARYDIAIGVRSLYRNTTADFMTAIGSSTYLWLTDGQGGIGIGYQTFEGTTFYTANFNTGVGYQVGRYILGTVVNNTNVLVGVQAGQGTSGSGIGNANTKIGSYSGWQGYGDNNINIGNYAGYRQTTASNLLIIDNQQRANTTVESTNSIIYGTMSALAANQSLYINAFGYVSEGLVVNDGGLPTGDLRWESDTEANMLLGDANADTDGALYLGGTTNGIKIGKGGELSLIGTATRFDDLRIEPTARTTGVKTPTLASWTGGLYLYDFDDAILASEKELFFTVQMPHSWKEGSAVEPHIHWVDKTTGTAGQVIRWGLEYTKASIGGTFGASTTIYGTTIEGGGNITVANEHMITDLGTINMTGETLSTILVCRLFRNSSDAADTYTGTAGLLYIDWHYEIDSMGSREEFVK